MNATFKNTSEDTDHSDVLPHAKQEGLDIVGRGWVYKLAVIEPQADPKVVHESWKTQHHSGDAQRTTKLITGSEQK